jgi:hypothetical protein
MGSRDIVLLRGHGIAAVGRTVMGATSLALRFETLCELMWQLTLSGRHLFEIGAEDKARYDPSRRAQAVPASRDWQSLMNVGDGEEMGWRGYIRRLERTAGLPDENVEGLG